MDLTRNQRKILYNLECDARSSQNLIARNCKVSQQSVSYTIETLQEQGKIKDFYTLYDYSKFGYNGFLCLFRLNDFSNSAVDSLADAITETGSAGWIYLLSGGYEVIALMLAKNTSQMNKKLKSIMAKGPEVSYYDVMPSVAIHESGKKYLNDGFTDREVHNRVLGADRPPVKIEDRKKALLKKLQENPRISMVEASKDMEVTSKTLIEWRKDLESSKVIRGYRPLLGGKELGIKSELVLVNINDKSREDEIRDYMIRQENFVSVVKTLGEFDFVAEIQAEDNSRIRNTIATMRENFGKLVEEHRTIEIDEKVSKRFLPDSAIEEAL